MQRFLISTAFSGSNSDIKATKSSKITSFKFVEDVWQEFLCFRQKGDFQEIKTNACLVFINESQSCFIFQENRLDKMIVRTSNGDFCWKVSFSCGNSNAINDMKKVPKLVKETNRNYLYFDDTVPSIFNQNSFSADISIPLEYNSFSFYTYHTITDIAIKPLCDVEDNWTPCPTYLILSHMGFFKSKNDCNLIKAKNLGTKSLFERQIPNCSIWDLTSNGTKFGIKDILQEKISEKTGKELYDLCNIYNEQDKLRLAVEDRFSQIDVFFVNHLKWRKLISSNSILIENGNLPENMLDSSDFLSTSISSYLEQKTGFNFCKVIYTSDNKLKESQIYESIMGCPIIMVVESINYPPSYRITIHLTSSSFSSQVFLLSFLDIGTNCSEHDFT